MKDNHYEPRHVRRYSDAVDPRCTPIPGDENDYRPRRYREETIPDEGPVVPEEVDDFF